MVTKDADNSASDMPESSDAKAAETLAQKHHRETREALLRASTPANMKRLARRGWRR